MPLQIRFCPSVNFGTGNYLTPYIIALSLVKYLSLRWMLKFYPIVDVFKEDIKQNCN